MIFKTKLSPKQFFSFKGTKYQAQDGIFRTEDKKLIDFLAINPNWINEKSNDKELMKNKNEHRN